LNTAPPALVTTAAAAPVQHGPGLRHRPLLGVTLIALMATCFATLDTTVRYVGALMPVLVVFWVRYLIQACVMGVWLLRTRPAPGFGTAHPRFQVLRGALLTASGAFSFFGVQYMPVPEFTSVIMLTPLLVIVLAAWLLHEHVDRLRWALVAGGFVGALVVIRPGSGLFGWVVLFPLLGACTFAGFQVLTRRLAGTEHPLTTHFYTGAVGSVLITPALLASGIDLGDVWAATSLNAWLLVGLIGLLGTVGHLLLILALGMAPTATLMPFTYVQIAAAVLLGAAVFGRIPDGIAIAGMLVISACGAAGAWLNFRRLPPPAVVADAIAD